MSVVDIVLAIILIAGAIRGLSRGLVREIVSLIGFALALFLANQRSADLSKLLDELLGPHLTVLHTPLVANVVAFALIVMAVTLAANFFGQLLTMLVGLLLLGFLNRAGGLVFGLVEASLTIVVALLLVAALSPATSNSIVSQSVIAANLVPYSSLVADLLPGTGIAVPSINPRLF